MKKLILSALISLLALAGCAHPQFASVEQAAYAGAICTDGGWTRVPDNYCPIGDEPVAGSQFFWRYRPYRDTDQDIHVVYVGQRLDDRSLWTDRRPDNVTTIYIQRGDFPERPAPGQPLTTEVDVPTKPARDRAAEDARKGIQRGGLGVSGGTQQQTAAAGKPAGKPAPPAKPLPPAPPTRVSAPSKTTGKK
jgi:hypothetical protein